MKYPTCSQAFMITNQIISQLEKTLYIFYFFNEEAKSRDLYPLLIRPHSSKISEKSSSLTISSYSCENKNILMPLKFSCHNINMHAKNTRLKGKFIYWHQGYNKTISQPSHFLILPKQ